MQGNAIVDHRTGGPLSSGGLSDTLAKPCCEECCTSLEGTEDEPW